MDRMTVFLPSVVLLAFVFACAEASAYNCPEPMQKLSNGDCGLFPDDPDIMRVPAHNSDAVVARWPSASGKPVRIINNSGHNIPVFLRTREEFQKFLENLDEDPDLDSCEVVDQYWKNTHQCAYQVSGGSIVPDSCFPWLSYLTSCDNVTVPMFFTCKGTRCGGTCSKAPDADKYGHVSAAYQGDKALIYVRPTDPPFTPCEPGCLKERFPVKEGCVFRPWQGGQSAKHGDIRVVKNPSYFLGSGTFVCARSGSRWKWHMLRYTCSCPSGVVRNGFCKP